MFKMWREVRGTYIQPRIGTIRNEARIDLILGPTPKLIAAGWCHGFIGVECKRTNTKIGPPISQMLDYGRAVWHLPPSGFRIMLNYVFLWPMKPLGGPIESIMMQNCLGSLSEYNGTLHFQTGHAHVADVSPDKASIGQRPEGRKSGSR